MALLEELKTLIEKDTHIRTHIKYTCNNTIYEIADDFRFIETFWKRGKKSYQLSSIEKSEYIQEICDTLRTRAVAMDDMKSLISADFENDEVEEFIEGLLDSGILISELQLGLTLADDTEKIIAVLEQLKENGINAAEKYLEVVKEINRCKEIMNTTASESLPLGNINKIRQLLAEIGITTTHVFHVDLRLQDDSTGLISNTLLKNITEAVDFLEKIAPVDSFMEIQLQQFKNIFRIRYESQEIPLTHVLDNESGIGYPPENSIGSVLESNILADITIDRQDMKKKGVNGLEEDWLLDRIELCTKEQSVVEITESDIKKQANYKAGSLSHNFSVMGTFCADQMFFLQNINNSHATSLLGRFAYLDPGINNLCTQIINDEKESNSDVIFAEIIYIPDGRAGNISRRPAFTNYEIPILATSGMSTEHQIPLSDIMLSVQDEEIILRAKTLNKRIIPRLSSAHNFNNSTVSAYKFLCALQYQHTPPMGINFSYESSKKRFYPRIVYKNIVLHRACWLLHKSDIIKITNAESPMNELKKYIGKWNVNQYVVLVNGDNELFLDVENESYLDLLLGELKSVSHICLAEWIHAFDSGSSDNTIKQVVLPLRNNKSVPYSNYSAPVQEVNIERSFPPGSEWLYIKLYCSAAVSDDILSLGITPLLKEWKEKSLISSGFFIRYADPHYHIRFRIKLRNTDHFSKVLRQLYAVFSAFVEKQKIWKIQLDTYEREIERYGIEQIEDAEQLFYHDSVLFLSYLKNEEFAENEQIRIYTAIKNIDRYLSLFRLSLSEKLQFCTEMEKAFEKEFNPQLKKHIYTRYREYSAEIYEFMTGKYFDEYFDNREVEAAKLNLSKDILPSYIHMSVNRWFTSQQRVYEYMCYVFAGKFYNRILNSKHV
ncbi:hypothetical protein FGE20_01375 [Elizabethkingia sp. JS20170427COW]|nr:hypothetical protein FGE20_01375 [Elizabethkingia sp. JS20170427COW]